MKRYASILAGVVLCAAVIYGIFAVSRRHRVVYEGKTVNQWLAVVFVTNTLPAFASMGPAALPELLEAFKAKETVWDRVYAWTYIHLPVGLQRSLTRPMSVGERRGAAEMVLLNSSNARSILPDLIKLLSDEDSNVAGGAASIVRNNLWRDDEAYAPVFLNLLQSTNVVVRRAAPGMLVQIGPDTNSALPALTRATKDNDFMVRILAALAMWQMARDTNGLPVLREAMLSKPDPAVPDGPFMAAFCLHAVDTNDLSVLPFFIAELKKPSSNFGPAAQVIADYGSRASEAVPALMQVVETGDRQSRAEALEALKKIAPAEAAKYESK